MDLAVIHHAGAYAAWSPADGRPLATGTDREKTLEDLVRRGLTATEADAMLDAATAHGSSIPSPAGGYVTASEAMEGNRAGAFEEEVPMEEIFRHLLIDRRPIR